MRNNEIRSFAENRNTLERTLGAITGISVHTAVMGGAIYGVGKMADINPDAGSVYNVGTGVILAGAGVAAISFIGYVLSRVSHRGSN